MASASAADSSQHFDATIGLGSNIGDKVHNIGRAISLLTNGGEVRLVAQSRLYRSQPWGVEDQDWFVNAVIAVATELSPRQLLERCQRVENAMRRVRLKKWGPRIIDVDILTYRDQRVAEANLTIPHPFIAQRAFVLVPLRDVAPDIMVGGKSIADMIGSVDVSVVEPI